MSVHPDKENCRRILQEPRDREAPRHVLGDLDENVPPSHFCYISTKATKSISNVCGTIKIRSFSTSEAHVPEIKRRFASVSEVDNIRINTENITVRQPIVETTDDVFVPGEHHYVNFVTRRSKPGICLPKNEVATEKPKPVVRLSEHGCVDKPARKVTLVRRLSKRRRSSSELYINSACEEEYLEDNIWYLLHKEEKYVLKKDALKRKIDECYRIRTVNWLVYVYQALDLSEHSFFVGIRMFDYVLVACNIPSYEYTLWGLTCIWISSKNFDCNVIPVSKLHAICSGKFSTLEILNTEKKVVATILSTYQYNLSFPEPVTFLFYFLKREDLQCDKEIRYKAMFLLENFTFLLDFSSTAPSLLAAIALYLVLEKHNIDTTAFLEYIQTYLVDVNLFKLKSAKMKHLIVYIISETKFNNEVITKYRSDWKMNVACNFLLA